MGSKRKKHLLTRLKSYRVSSCDLEALVVLLECVVLEADGGRLGLGDFGEQSRSLVYSVLTDVDVLGIRSHRPTLYNHTDESSYWRLSLLR